LLGIYLRSNKVITLLLILLPFLFAYAASASNLAILQTPEQLNTYIAQNQGNVLLGMIASNTIAGVTIWRIRISTAIITSILSIVLIISNTRKDEEQGRLELLRAGAVGMKAPLTAVLLKVFGANVLGGLMMAVGFMAAGFPALGSVVAGLATALCNCCLAAVATIAAQVAPNAQLARGISFGVVAFFFFSLAIANVSGNEGLLLWSPFGWCAYARPYAGENFLLFPFAILIVALLTVNAYVLAGRRDLGGSFFQEQWGRSNGRKSFKSPLALAWQIQRGMLFVWVLAYAVMGLVIASLVPSINTMLAGTNFLPELSVLLGGAGKAFLAILAYILTQVLTAYAIMAILRLRDEEAGLRTELVLAGSASRSCYASAHLLITFAGSALALALFGLFSGDFASCIARLPAVWLIASITAFLYGLLPRVAASVSWSLMGILLILEFLWEMRIIGNDVFMLSPFARVYPGVPISLLSSVSMLLAAAILVGLGLFSFSRRDIVGE
jgi:ABC-2 type transport system permease protein